MANKTDIPPAPAAEEYATSRDIAELSGQVAALREQISALEDLVKEQKDKAEILKSRIKLNRKTLEALMKVSKETIYRWCRGENGRYLRNYKEENGELYFYLKEVYEAVHSGAIYCKGLNCDVVLQRLREYNAGKLELFPVTVGSGGERF